MHGWEFTQFEKNYISLLGGGMKNFLTFMDFRVWCCVVPCLQDPEELHTENKYCIPLDLEKESKSLL